MNYDMNFYKGKNILITGHTGFKGSWLCRILVNVGAKVTGYSLLPPTNPNLYEMSGVAEHINSIEGDIRDLEHMMEVFEKVQPEFVIHMAAQPICRESYANPVYTYETNVMGTVNILECVRNTPSVKSFLNVTTDKVYQNKEWCWGYREDDVLNGFDPYSNSKSCSELVTSSYINSFLKEKRIAISTARAGNVIGGGDFAKDRIIPDCVRAIQYGHEIIVRNPYSIRPYQHVLEPLVAYLTILRRQYEDIELAGNYNVGPNDSDCISTGELVSLYCEKWCNRTGHIVKWINQHDGGPHEANFLKLDCSKIEKTFGWKPRWNIDKTMEMIIEWNEIFLSKGEIASCMDDQIQKYMEND